MPVSYSAVRVVLTPDAEGEFGALLESVVVIVKIGHRDRFYDQ